MPRRPALSRISLAVGALGLTTALGASTFADFTGVARESKAGSSSVAAGSGSPSGSPSADSRIPAPKPPPSPTAPSAAVWVRPGEIPVGSCVDIADGITHTTMSQVPCTGMHDGQVFVQLTLGKDIPSENDDDEDIEAWMERLGDKCEPAFDQFTGAAWDESRLTFNMWVPDFAEIAAGHRAVTCYIEMYDQSRYSGSALGKNDEKQFKHAPGWRPPTDKELFLDEEQSHRA